MRDSHNKPSNFYLVVTIFLLIFLNFSSVCFSEKAEVDLKEKAKITQIKIALAKKEKNLNFLPLYLAIDKGLFKKNNIAVELVFVGEEAKVLSEVLEGKASFGIGDAMLPAISFDKGGGGKIIGTINTKLGLFGFSSNHEIKGIKVPQDLLNLKVGISPRPSQAFTFINQYFLENNLFRLGADLLPVVRGEELPVLESRQIDIVMDIEPNISIIMEKGFNLVFPYDLYTQKQSVIGVMTSERVIDTSPVLIKNFLLALQEALFLLSRKEAIVYETAKQNFPHAKSEIITKALNRLFSIEIFPDSLVTNQEAWDRTLTLRAKSGDISGKQRMSDVVENNFAEYVKKILK